MYKIHTYIYYINIERGYEPIWDIIHIYIWKCHNEISSIPIFYKQKYLFSKRKDRKVKQVLLAGRYQCEGGGYEESVVGESTVPL
jgi:hypothetical protein